MSQEGRGRDLFIADNSAARCIILHHPQEYFRTAATFDIAGGSAA